MNLATRLLIVDDDPGIRELTASFLMAHGYVVDMAEDGAAMRTAIARQDYALKGCCQSNANRSPHDAARALNAAA